MKHENRCCDISTEGKIVAMVSLIFVVAMTILFELVRIG